MFIAHIGVGFAAKKFCPNTSLGVLLLAGQAVDVLCGVLMVTGLERMRVAPGNTAMTPLEFISYPWSHGLAMNIVWAVLAAAIAHHRYRSLRTTGILAGLVFSHWVLDFISHKPDLPLLFDSSPKVGLGLWNNVPATLTFELGVFILGPFLYLTATRARDRIGNWALASLWLFFAGMFLLNHYGPQAPVDMPQKLLALPILVLIFILPWGHWIEKHRAMA